MKLHVVHGAGTARHMVTAAAGGLPSNGSVLFSTLLPCCCQLLWIRWCWGAGVVIYRYHEKNDTTNVGPM
jgi:hypothetical protein